MSEILDSIFRKLRNALLVSTEGVKEVTIIDSKPEVFIADEIIYSHLVVVKVVPGFSKDRRRLLTECFNVMTSNWPVGTAKLEIDDQPPFIP